MNYNKFFQLAKEAGIEEAELSITSGYSLNVSTFHGEIDNYSVEDSSTYTARGIINGKFGAATCDVYNAEKAAFLVEEIVKNAKVIEKDDPAILFKGSEKYHKINTFNNELAKIPTEQKINKLFEIEKKIRQADPRIVEVQGVEYSESSDSITIMNSHGLKLSQKLNYFYYVGAALAQENGQVKSGYDIFLENDFSKFNEDELVKKFVEKTVSQLGGEACESSDYKAVFSPEATAALLRVYMGHANSEDVQKHSSLFIGKLNQKVASSKVTIEDKPLQRNMYARWFDDEGVATYNKAIVKNGILQTYLYNLTTASKEGVQSTGNGSKRGGEVGVSPFNLYLKPGKKSQEELFQEVGNGVYITALQGLHAGMNPQSGNFSLQSEGFLIKDGKKDRGLDLITVSGNLVDLFQNILEVGADSKLLTGGITTSSILVKKIAVGGK